MTEVVDEPGVDGYLSLLEVILRSQDDERREAADRLHDDAIPTMYGAALALEGLARQTSDPAVATVARDVALALTGGGDRLRDLMRELQCAGIAGPAHAKNWRGNRAGTPEISARPGSEFEPTASFGGDGGCRRWARV